MFDMVYNHSCVEGTAQNKQRKNKITVCEINTSGCGSVWLECLIWDQEAAGSNPVTPIR